LKKSIGPLPLSNITKGLEFPIKLKCFWLIPETVFQAEWNGWILLCTDIEWSSFSSSVEFWISLLLLFSNNGSVSLSSILSLKESYDSFNESIIIFSSIL